MAARAQRTDIILLEMPEHLAQLFARYGYAVIFVGVLLENAGVPSPGHTVVLGGAFLAQNGRLSIVWVFATACVAAVLGDNIGYWIGRKGGRPLIERHARLLHLNEERIRWIESFFERHGAKTVFIARFVTGLQTVAALFAGMSRMRWSRFFIFNVVGAIAWSASYCAAGYFFGKSWDLLHEWMGRAALFALALVVALALLVLLRRRGAWLVAWLEARLPAGLPLRLIVVMGVALGTAGVFGKLAADVADKETSGLDRVVSIALHRLDSPAVDVAMRAASALGTWQVLTGAVIVVSLWCARRGDRLAALVLPGVGAGAALLNVLLKYAFERPRPDLFYEVARPAGYSFPSGHTMGATTVYGLVAFIVSRECPDSRWAPFAAAAFLIVIIGISRIFLGVHWATDVVGGFAGGAFAVLVGVAVLELMPTKPS
jgi:membrane protein DedA with SNARE-associated domain/membrane-associated phospholipid phosphatase